MPVLEISFRNDKGERLKGTLHWPTRVRAKAGVVFLHGHPGVHGSARFARFARAIARAGVPALRFDFSGSGSSPGRLGEGTYRERVSEARAAMDVLSRRGVRRIGLVGDSMGGAIALLTSREDRRVFSMVVTAPVVFPYRTHRRGLSRAERRMLTRRGFVSLRARNGQLWRLTRRFLRESRRAKPLSAGAGFHKPLLILAGTHDRTVFLSELKTLAKRCDPELTRLISIRNADHHLWQRVGNERRIIGAGMRWFRRFLFPDAVPGVNAFLRVGREFLFLQRSDRVATHRRFWHVVGGYLGQLAPRERALREIAEEIGVPRQHVRFERQGKTCILRDPVFGRTFVVHPFLFALERKPRIRLDWEHTAYQWTTLRAARRLRMIPGFARMLVRLGLSR